MIVQIVRDLYWAMRSWWRNDRIRASPREGRLWRLRPGDLVVFGDMEAEVLTRSVVDRPAGPALSLTCRTASGTAEFEVSLTSVGRSAVVVWKTADGSRPVSEDEMVIWPRSRVL